MQPGAGLIGLSTNSVRAKTKMAIVYSAKKGRPSEGQREIFKCACAQSISGHCSLSWSGRAAGLEQLAERNIKKETAHPAVSL
jgi:hypothetical protein